MLNISTRFQWTLMEAARSQITTLELHSSPFISYLYTIPRVVLEQLQSLHLVEHLGHEAPPFLTRVVLCIEAPNLQVLSLCNCLSGDPIPIWEAVRYFSHRLTTLALLNDQRPEMDVLFPHVPLPPLPNVIHLELKASWASLYLAASADTIPGLQSLSFQALPEQILVGLQAVNWQELKSAWRQVDERVRRLEWCCRSGAPLPPDSLLAIVKENMASADWVLTDAVQLCESCRNPLPIWPDYEGDYGARLAWGTHD
ncbi:hypothetical protein AAF712_006032 [Marasmius tenuissimus]|uniref:Uncharacterized protein n=1 Tax=Marasmius tenuissimus TaxID=585030 RepID=A0ABR3A2M7_9AGAR